MQPSRSHTLAHGAIAGVLAGSVVALWFLIVDLAAGQPLRTPLLLASALLGAPRDPGPLLVASYTIIHYAVFAGLGMGAAAALRAAGIAPGLALGAVFGIGVLDGVHYGALLLTGTGALAVLPPVHVLAANLAGGMAMMVYLHRAFQSEEPLGIRTLRDFPLLERGLITGAIGAVAVALWMLGIDLAMGRPLFTPAALGSVFFLGADSPAGVQVTLPVVAAYTVLHLSAFAVVGIALEWTAGRIERAPGMWLMALLSFIVLEALFLGTISGIGQWVLDAIGFFAVASANIVAIAAMGYWVWERHPALRRELAAAGAVP
ncbi:MAG TPA: hypothetical protein VMM18_00330 [Gemmatimonadaceae bacterium]|nr:hypothetical protein [Gemmatimonadaceae bacterium]